MKKFLVMIICLILIAMSITTIGSVTGADDRAAGDKPAVGATVSISWTDNTNFLFFMGTVNSEGYYEIAVPPGKCTVTANLDGYADNGTTQFTVSGSESVTKDIRLKNFPEKNATIKGNVKDKDSSANIEGVMVTVTVSVTENGGPVAYDFSGKTASNGNYEIAVAPGKITMVMFSKDGYFYSASMPDENISASGEKVYDGTLEKYPANDITVTGQVKDASSSNPLVNASVIVTSDIDPDPFMIKSAIRPGSTDANGNYSIEAPAGNITVSVLFGGYFTKTTAGFNTTSGNVYYQNLSLTAHPSKTATVKGNVYLPKDITPPVISNVKAEPSSKTAIIAWKTNEPADSKVYYGTNQSNLDLEAIKGDFVTEHSVKLTDLSPETKYYYKVESKDETGNPAVSAVLSFETSAADKTPPKIMIDSVAAKNITKTGAKIVWETDEKSNSTVIYGNSKEQLDKTARNSTLTKSHVVEISGLAAGTTYYYQVNSSDMEGNFNATTGEPYSFTTVSEPSVVEKGSVYGYVKTEDKTKEETEWIGNTTDMPLLVFTFDQDASVIKLIVIQNDDEARGKEIKLMFDNGEDAKITLSDNATVVQEFDVAVHSIKKMNLTVTSFYDTGNVSFSLVKVVFYGPVAGANVWLNETVNKTTDSNGYYEFKDIQTGSYKMKVTHANLETKENDYDVEIKKNDMKMMNFTVKPKSVEPVKKQVTIGPIVDEDGKPVEGAKVTINGKTAKTDDKGNAVFEFEEKDLAKTYTVKVEADDFDDLEFDVDIDADGTVTPDTDDGKIPQMKEAKDSEGGLSTAMIAVILIIIIVLVVIGILASRKGKASSSTPPPPPPEKGEEEEEEEDEYDEEEDEEEEGVSWEEDEEETEDEDEFEEEEDEEEEGEEEEEEEEEDLDLDSMPCPKCGSTITIPSKERPITVECDECGAKGKLTK